MIVPAMAIFEWKSRQDRVNWAETADIVPAGIFYHQEVKPKPRP